MSVTESTDHSAEEHAEGHHESPQERHKKEHMATWLFIGGDMVIFALEIFFWFYLRALNTNGMWIGAQCSPANPCTDGLGNPISHPITQEVKWHTLIIAAVIILAAVFIWMGEVQARKSSPKSVVTPLLGFGVLFTLLALALQFWQFQVLPFTTIDGAYASTFEFIMGANVAHFLVVLTIGLGIFNRSRKGMYENGNWYQLHLSRLFAVWVAVSCTLLAIMASFFA